MAGAWKNRSTLTCGSALSITQLRAQCNRQNECGHRHASHEADSEKRDGRATAEVERPARAISSRDEQRRVLAVAVQLTRRQWSAQRNRFGGGGRGFHVGSFGRKPAVATEEQQRSDSTEGQSAKASWTKIGSSTRGTVLYCQPFGNPSGLK
jgi:hypothetical protein